MPENGMEKKKMKAIRIYVPDDMYEFIKNNPQLNVSGWFRQKFRKRMEDEIFLLDR